MDLNRGRIWHYQSLYNDITFFYTQSRTLDKKEKKHHIPLVDRTPVEPPPILIAIVGPPKVGKTTLLKCLIKNFTRQKLSTVDGPVTIVSGEWRVILTCYDSDFN